ncbi:MAG: tRNA (adenosine(37)-N6)-dimethylallyltransferase MiaA [Bacteroidales bacterium]|nr:tRNA (adenosine(37)-N6)-dimethylallyltransferase MiaA [Bacteroidales bacterium]
MVEISRMLVVLGATATGKTKLAVELAHQLEGEIISSDSRQVYKGLDVGTGKDLEIYQQVFPPVPYHLIDIREPGDTYNVFEFKRDCIQTALEIERRGKLPVVCGGTGLYLDAIIFDYHFHPVQPQKSFRDELKRLSNEEMVYKLEILGIPLREEDKHNRHRLMRKLEIAYFPALQKDILSIQIKHLCVIGIKMDRQIIRQRITQRLERRLQDEGMIEEVRQLLKKGLSPEWLISLGLEYKYVTLYLQKLITYDEMKNQLEKAIHQFAKRQETWFRRMEKKGLIIYWYDPTRNDFENLFNHIKKTLRIS